MAKSKIEWTNRVWNPVTGCSKVSQGCKYCYAELMAKRFWGERKFTDVRLHPGRLDQPLRWKKPSRVFVDSMSDLFHENVSLRFISAVWMRMIATPHHTYQILTKRPQRMAEIVPQLFTDLYTDEPYLAKNIWLGVSVEDQSTADERIPILLSTPAATRFISCEPLLGSVDLGRYLHTLRVYNGPDCPNGISYGLDWVIVGGESGPHARPMHPDWVRSIRDQCQASDVPFFFKQWGEWAPADQAAIWRPEKHSVPGLQPFSNYQDVHKVGKKNAGRLLDGQEWNEFPDVIA